MLKLCCQSCGVTHFYDESLVNYAFDSVYVECYNCSRKINISYETAAVFTQSIITVSLPVLPIGTLVIVTNKEHVWAGDIGIIRDKKFQHYRIEIHGQLVWVPEDWVKQNELDDTD
jgi:uncharacterized Zn finger protein